MNLITKVTLGSDSFHSVISTTATESVEPISILAIIVIDLVQGTLAGCKNRTYDNEQIISRFRYFQYEMDILQLHPFRKNKHLSFQLQVTWMIVVKSLMLATEMPLLLVKLINEIGCMFWKSYWETEQKFLLKWSNSEYAISM